jgi:hypothetical protein
MKKSLLTVFVLLFWTAIFGQKTELRISLNSGLFSFSGQSAEKMTAINYSNSTNSGYTNNPYGSKTGLCYGLSANLKTISKQNIVLGLDVGYETLRSNVAINAANSIAAVG